MVHPCLFLFSMCVKVFKISRFTLFVGALATSILSELAVANSTWIGSQRVDAYWLGDKRLYTYAVYFFLGTSVSFRSD